MPFLGRSIAGEYSLRLAASPNAAVVGIRCHGPAEGRLSLPQGGARQAKPLPPVKYESVARVLVCWSPSAVKPFSSR